MNGKDCDRCAWHTVADGEDRCTYWETDVLVPCHAYQEVER